MKLEKQDLTKPKSSRFYKILKDIKALNINSTRIDSGKADVSSIDSKIFVIETKDGIDIDLYVSAKDYNVLLIEINEISIYHFKKSSPTISTNNVVALIKRKYENIKTRLELSNRKMRIDDDTQDKNKGKENSLIVNKIKDLTKGSNQFIIINEKGLFLSDKEGLFTSINKEIKTFNTKAKAIVEAKKLKSIKIIKV